MPSSNFVEGRRAGDSMKSTWRKDKSQWGFYHRFFIILDAFHNYEPYQEVPKFAKTDKIPYLTEWSCHRYILLRAFWPIAVQYLLTNVIGWRLHPVGMFLLYTAAMQLNSIREVKCIRRLAQKVGWLDGEKPRDEVPDVGVGKVFYSLQMTTTIRPLLTMFCAYSSKQPFSLSWWLPVELALYCVVLDGFFYLYHRSCHEQDALWKYHRTHHLTKHPNALLSSYADEEQEFLEIALIPFLTWATLKFVFQLPMGFHDWWVCHEYLIFTEAFGHSGLRVYATTTTIAAPILKYFDCELVVEDHDLHHRQGWRKSMNYGKQTRVWDRIFGTCGKRIESGYENVDFNNQIDFPLF